MQQILNISRTSAYRVLQQLSDILEMHGTTGVSTYYALKGFSNVPQTFQKWGEENSIYDIKYWLSTYNIFQQTFQKRFKNTNTPINIKDSGIKTTNRQNKNYLAQKHTTHSITHP